jgi:NADH-quinone oxidoreductase subunit L
MHGLYTLLLNKYYVDEIYLALIVRPLLWVSTNVLWHTVDEKVIDGAVNGVASSARGIGGEVRQIQSGNPRSYATWVVIGAVGVTVLVLGVWGMVR